MSSNQRVYHAPCMGELQGKVAFITGGSGSMGKAIAAALAAHGAAVAVADLPTRTAQVEELVRTLSTTRRNPQLLPEPLEHNGSTSGGSPRRSCWARLCARHGGCGLSGEDKDGV
jgi:NAD(P)-dependent dehydrogenase (short-subunit alcohol dehydrogenase family)